LIKIAKKKNTYKVARIGWENENPFVNIVLLSRKERQNLEIDKGKPVKVKKGKKSEVAIVEIQFRDLLSQESVCTLNKKLSDKLGAGEGDTVEISKEVTESEYAEFQRESTQANPFLSMLMGA